MSTFSLCLLIIFLFPACSEKVKTLPEIDLKEIHLDQCQVLYYKLEYYNQYGIIYLKKGGYIDENNIRDMKIFKNDIFILTEQDRVYRYNMENSNMEQEFIPTDPAPVIAFDIDTLNRTVALLKENALHLYNEEGEAIKKIGIDPAQTYTSCTFLDKGKIVLVSSKVPNCVYSVIDTTGRVLNSVKADVDNKKEFNLSIPSYCIGIDSNTILYKNILNDTIYKFINNQFKPYLYGEIGKYKPIYKGKDKFKENARFKVLNIWHTYKYWFIQYNHWIKFRGKTFNLTGMAVLDKYRNLLDSDLDSYIKGRRVYLESKLPMFVNKENTTFYQVYKKTKTKLRWNPSNEETPDSVCINYFRVKENGYRRINRFSSKHTQG